MLTWIVLGIAVLFSLTIWAIAMSSLVGFMAVRVPLVFTRKKEFRALLKYLDIKPNQKFYELGCGTGRNSFLTKRIAGAEVTGFEYVLWSCLFAKLRNTLTGNKLKFVRGNFFKSSWKEADFLYCYLLPNIMPGVGEKFLTEGKPGAKLISYDFPIKSLEPIGTLRTGSSHTFYIYQI